MNNFLLFFRTSFSIINYDLSVCDNVFVYLHGLGC